MYVFIKMYSKIKLHLNSLFSLDFKVSLILLLELIFYKVVNLRLLKYFLNKNFKNKLNKKTKLTYLIKVTEEAGFVLNREMKPKNYYRPMLIACSPNKLDTIS